MLKELLDAGVTLLTQGWPTAIVIVAVIYRKKLIQVVDDVIPRMRKVGPVEFDSAIAAQADAQSAIEQLNGATLEQLDAPAPTRSIAEAEQKIRDSVTPAEQAKLVPLLFRALAMTTTALEFEKAYNIIFGSQIAAMKGLNMRPLTTDEMKGFYDIAARAHPEFYGGFGFENWLQFPLAANYFAREGDTFTATHKTRDFLTYLIQNGKSEERAY